MARRRRSAAGWAVLGVLAWASLAATGLRGPAAYVSASVVDVNETSLPACGPGVRTTRRVVMAVAYLPRPDAMRVAHVRIRDGGMTWMVRREAGLCRVADPDGVVSEEPCLLESCQDGYCAVRIPYSPRSGSTETDLTFTDASGSVLGSGRANVRGHGGGSPPVLEVARAGRQLTVSAPGMPDGSARATVTREGKAVGDAPLNLDRDGRASLRVPSGFDGVMISVSEGDAGGVRQSTVHVDGPFDVDCPPAP